MSPPILVDAHGAPLVRSAPARGVKTSAYGDSAFDAASFGRELHRFYGHQGSADAVINPENDQIRYRARALDRNESGVVAPLLSAANAIVGPALTFTPAPDHVALGKSPEWADEWAEKVQSILTPWFESTDCDASRIDSFGKLTHLVLSSTMLNGGVIALPQWLPEDGFTHWGTAMQLVEIDRLCNPDNGMDTDVLRGGVEINERGAPQAYHLMTQHPGDMGLLGHVQSWERVPAWTDWKVRPRCLHIFDRTRIGQNRGVSILAPVIPDFHTLGRYRQAELQAALSSALIALFTQMKDMPWDQVMELFEGPKEMLEFRNRQIDLMRRGQPSGGMVIPLAPGEEIKSHIPNRPNPNFEPFNKGILRQAYGAMGMAYEIGSKDLGGLNYSAARSAILETWRTWGTQRVWLAERWAKPCYRMIFEEAVNAGKIPDCTPDDLYRNFIAWTGSKWNGPGMGWVDPVKEGEGVKLRIANLQSTLEKEAGDQGGNWRKNVEQQAVERAFCKRKGVPYPGDMPINPAAVPGHNRPPVDQNGDELES